MAVPLANAPIASMDQQLRSLIAGNFSRPINRVTLRVVH